MGAAKRYFLEQSEAALHATSNDDPPRLTLPRVAAAVVQASGAIVFSYDTEGRIDSLSGDTAALIGWTQEEMLGRLTLDLIYPSERSAIAGKMTARLHGTAAAAPYETLLLHRDGHAVPILVTGGPRVEQGRIAGGAGALTDLSALRRLQAERDAAQRASDRAEGAMRTGRAVAHELSSPLGSILVLTELVASDARLSADIREDLLIVQAEAARAGALL